MAPRAAFGYSRQLSGGLASNAFAFASAVSGLSKIGCNQLKKQRFFLWSKGFGVCGLALLGLLAAAATAAQEDFDARVQDALARLQEQDKAAREVLELAKGVLVFPTVVKAGFGLGGAVGDGALLIDGETVQHYRTTKASIGFQFGVQARSEVILFLTDAALNHFRASNGWEAGVDGSIAIAEFGAVRDIDTNNTQQPIVGFVFGSQGLMYDLSLSGSKYWRINKKNSGGEGQEEAGAASDLRGQSGDAG